MASPRKIFRIEETAAQRHAPQMEETQAASRHADVMQELGALRAILAAASPRPAGSAPFKQAAVGRLTAELMLIQSIMSGTQPELSYLAASRAPAEEMTRMTHELEAVMNGSELATQKILAAAEDIDQAANNLSASLKGGAEQGLAQDILDRVIQIFEACNFQDLTSQRVAKVIAAFAHMEARIARVLEELTRGDRAPPVHGPCLEGDRGHVSQSDVDAMFDSRTN